MLIEQHEWRPGGQRFGHRPFGSGLTAQQSRQRVCAVGNQFSVRELNDFPGSVRPPDSSRICAGEERTIGNRRKLASEDAHASGCTMPSGRRPRGKVIESLPHDRRRQCLRGEAVA
jgi:hypothetical protein